MINLKSQIKKYLIEKKNGIRNLCVLNECIVSWGLPVELILANTTDKALIYHIITLLVSFLSEITELIDDYTSADLNENDQ